MLTLVNIFNVFKYGLTGVFLFIDGIVYWAISKLFALYEALAKVEFITQSDYQEIANKFYVVIGVVMLFYLTYSLLKTLINPDDFNKNISKIATNLVISLILLGIVPLIFSYAFQIQDAIISENIIGNLVLGGSINENSDSKNSVSHDGNSATISILNTFLNPGKKDFDGEETTWNEFLTNANEGDSKAFLNITDFAEPVHDGDVEYMPIVSTLCGAFLIYVLISFCIDLGIRVAKLAFYEIIAPIPILMRVIPEKKSVFDNWVKGTLATFMEVFIRLFIMFIIVLLVGLIFDDAHLNLFDNNVGFIGNVIVVLGLFAFAKQAPKLISDVIGIDSGNIKLGIGGKLAAGGAFGMAAVLGGAAISGTQRLTGGAKNVGASWNNLKNSHGFWDKAAASFGLAGSTAGYLKDFAGGVITGGFKSGVSGFSAKNFTETKKAVTEGIKEVAGKQADKESYKANHGDNIVGVTIGHVKDFAQKFEETIGLAAGLEALKKEQSKANEVQSARKAIDDRLKAVLDRDKNKLTSRSRYDVTGVTAPGAGFNNYATLLNEMEMMKSTGKTSSGVQVTSQMLTDMAKAEYDMREQMKKDILAGYDLENNPNAKFTALEFQTKYDAQLQSLVTDYRTKAFQNASIIANNADRSIQTVDAAVNTYLNQAVDNRKQEIYDFISNDNANELFEKASNDAIKSATRTLDSKVAAKYEQEAKK